MGDGAGAGYWEDGNGAGYDDWQGGFWLYWVTRTGALCALVPLAFVVSPRNTKVLEKT